MPACGWCPWRPPLPDPRLRPVPTLGGARQVLDDSTCKATRALVDDKVLEWKERGVNCECIRRTNRQGYKAGALKEVRPARPRPTARCCGGGQACGLRGGGRSGVVVVASP